MRKSLKVATTVATVGALALGSAAPAQAGPEHWPYISANNGDPLRNSPVTKEQLPASSRNLYNQGYLDEVLVGLGIAAILAVTIGAAVTNRTNLDQALNGQFRDRLPF